MKQTATKITKNTKLLVICESPNKVQHISEYLKKAGYNVRVMASVGHVMELANSGKYHNTGVDPDDGFKMDIQVDPEKRDVIKKLKTQADWADVVAIMSDGDREGEVIGWSLVKFLKLPKSKYVRAITHEITPKAVVKAIENPIELDEKLIEAGLARLALDKMMGYRLSGIVKKTVGAKSAGRCQSCGLKIIADREREIRDFVPETYFDLYVNFKKNKTDFKAKYIGTAVKQVEHLKSEAEVDSAKKLCVGDYIVQGVDKKERQEAPKPPFNTPNFQQEASSKLGLSVKDAMSLAQRAFEAGYITYHRTDDDSISPEFLPILEAYVKKAYGEGAYHKPRAGKKTGDEQAGHECLRVTDPALTPEFLDKKEPNKLLCKVYRLIWQRTIASCLPNAIYSDTGYLIDNSGQKFLLTSKELVKAGFKAVYDYKDDADKDEAVKETFVKGETLKNCKLTDEKKQTKAPARYTEATLVKKLQASGVGRPSTYATIVETVLSPSRGYAEKDGKAIAPTEKGMKLAEFLDKDFGDVIKLDYTKTMEEQLDEIATGKLTRKAFLSDFYTTMENAIKANPAIANIGKSSTLDRKCPKCGKQLVIRHGKYGEFIGCTGWPNCDYIEKKKQS